MSLVKYNNNSLSAITSTGLTAGAMTLIKSQTASSSSTISFVHGTSDVVLDSTYPIYVFKLFNCTANGSSSSTFQVNFSIDGGSNYNVTKTTTIFWAHHYENGSDSGVNYKSSSDLAQSTSFQDFTDNSLGAGADESLSGTLYLFNPSSDVFVKHFMASVNWYHDADITVNPYVAGYCNTTSAVNAVQFKMASGNIDGTIKLYGIKDS
jgi:hypothetical protein